MTLVTLLCTLAAVGLIAVGGLALLSPVRLARSYGVGVDDAAARVYVRATGARDVILGVVLGAATFQGEPIALLFLCSMGVVLSLVDFSLAFAFTRQMRSELAAHLGGAAGFIVIVVLLLQAMRR
jgi:hypothetical protein